jgi:hypothetical protein
MTGVVYGDIRMETSERRHRLGVLLVACNVHSRQDCAPNAMTLTVLH